MPPFLHPVRRARRAITPKPIRRATRTVYRVRHPVRASFWDLWWGKNRKPKKAGGTPKQRRALTPTIPMAVGEKPARAEENYDRTQYRLAHAEEVAEAESPTVTVTEVPRDGEVGTFNIEVAAPDLSSIDPRLQTTLADLEREEATVAEVWAEVARRTGGRAVSPAQLHEIADSVIAERHTR
jgi:hypothetical protein